MTLEPIEAGDYRVGIKGMRAGRIMRTMRGGGQTEWFFSLPGPDMNSGGFQSAGGAGRWLEAKAAFLLVLHLWLNGAIALCDEEVPPGERNPHRSERLAAAAANGAGALLILSSASGGLARTGVCHPHLSPIASLGIAREDGLRLRRLLAGGSAPHLTLRMRNRQTAGRGRSILAQIPGHDPDAGLVLAGAHLDSWDLAQGATDNGLGVAIVLEMARVLALLPAPARPRADLRFALWTGEETGLLGSSAYVDAHRADLPRHRAVMNFDMTGAPYGYWLPGLPDAGSMLPRLAEQLAPLGMEARVYHKAGLHSDHQPFIGAGVPIVSLLGR